MKNISYKSINGKITYVNRLSKEKYIKIKFHNKKRNLKKMILTAGPSVSSRELVYTLDAAMSGWNENSDYYLEKLSKSFSNFIGVNYAIPTSSCTGALHIALKALGIKKGDEVIIPNITWVATASVVQFVGAKPIFADVDMDDWNISPDEIKKLITKKTRVIIVVHLYGHPAKMKEIKAIAKKNNIKLIEDAAPAIGAKYMKKKCGTFGDFSAFSFQGAKLVVSGEGGILLTNNYDLYKKAKKIWDFGRNEKKTFWIDGPGLKYKMSNLQAAFTLAQLERVRELIINKRRIFNLYKKELKPLLGKKIFLNEEIKNCKSIYWMTSLRIIDFKKISRNHLIKFLRNNKIDSRPIFPAISEYPIWRMNRKTTKNASILSKSVINLHSGVNLSFKQIEYICNKIKQFFKKYE